MAVRPGLQRAAAGGDRSRPPGDRVLFRRLYLKPRGRSSAGSWTLARDRRGWWISCVACNGSADCAAWHGLAGSTQKRILRMEKRTPSFSPFGAFFICPKKDPGCPISRSFFARCGIPRLFAPDFFEAETFSAACLAAEVRFFHPLNSLMR